MTDFNINTDSLHAHVHPAFWPILWLNLYLLRRWYAAHGDRIGAAEYTTSNFGIIRITKIYPRADVTLAQMRRFEKTTDTWCMDQLGHLARMFARANAVKIPAVLTLLSALIAIGHAPHPAINDSS